MELSEQEHKFDMAISENAGYIKCLNDLFDTIVRPAILNTSPEEEDDTD